MCDLESVLVMQSSDCLLGNHGFSVCGILQVKNSGVVSPSLLQGIFLTQGLNPSLLHCRWILSHLCHQESPSPLLATITLNWLIPTFALVLQRAGSMYLLSGSVYISLTAVILVITGWSWFSLSSVRWSITSFPTRLNMNYNLIFDISMTQYVRSLCFHRVPGHVWAVGDARRGFPDGYTLMKYTTRHRERTSFRTK